MPNSAAALARTVLSRNLRVRKGESVLIETWSHSLDYAPAFVEEARRLGAQPTVLYEDEGAYWNAVEAKQFGPFAHLSKAEKAAVGNAGAYVYFWGPAAMRRAMDLGPSVGERLTAFNEEWYAAAAKGTLRGCRMSLGLASEPTAKGFGLDLGEWRRRLVDAGAVDSSVLLAKGERLRRHLEHGKELTLRHPNGTNLTIPLRKPTTRVDSGLVTPDARRRPFGVMANNPTGQVFATLDGSKSSGTLVGNRPVYNMVSYEKSTAGSWEFQGGKLTQHEMTQGEEAFESAFQAAPKGREQLSYISIGTNPRSRELAPCEDTEEGAVLVGIGGNSGFGGKLQIPFQGYAMVGGATVEIDGRTVIRGGKVL